MTNTTTFLGKHGIYIIQFVFGLALWFWYYQLAKNDKNTGFWPTVLLIWAIIFTSGFIFSNYRRFKEGSSLNRTKNGTNNKNNNYPSNRKNFNHTDGMGGNTRQS